MAQALVTGSVVVELTADSKKFVDGFNNAINKSKEFRKSADADARDISNAFINVGNVVSYALGNVVSSMLEKGIDALKNLASNAIEAGMEYEKTFINLSMTAKKFNQDVSQTERVANELGKTLKIGPIAAAEALDYTLKSGLNLEQSADLIKRFANEALTGKRSTIELSTAVRNLAFGFYAGNSAITERSGISENWSDITKRGAAILGLEYSKLTEAEKARARYLGVIELTNITLGAANQLQGSLIDSQMLLNYWVEQTYINVGRKLNPVLNYFYKIVLGIAPALSGFIELLADNLAKTFQSIVDSPDVFLSIITGIGTTLSVLVIPAILTSIKTLVALAWAVTVAVWPLLLLAGAVGGLFYLFQTNQAVKQFLTNVWNKLVSGFLYFYEKVLIKVQKALDIFMKWWTLTAQPQILGFISNSWDKLVNVFIYFKDSILPAVINKLNQFRDYWNSTLSPQIKGFLINTWQALSDAFVYFKDQILPTIVDKLRQFRDYWNSTLSPQIKGFLANTWKVLSDAFVYFKDELLPKIILKLQDFINWWLTNIQPPINDFVTNTWNKLVEAFVYFKDEVLPQIIPKLLEFANWWLTNIQPPINDFVTNTWNKLVEGFIYFKDTVIPQIIPKLLEFANWWTNDIQPKINNFITNTWENLKKAFEFFTTVLWPNLIKPTLDDLKEAWDSLSPVLMDLWALFQQYILPLLGPIVGGAVLGLLMIIRIAAHGLAAVAEGIRVFWDSVKRSVENVIAGIIQIGKAFVDFLIGIVTGDMKRIENSLYDILRGIERINFWQVGVDLITGLINGIGSMFGKVAAKAQALADQITNTIKGALKVESPSKIMIDVGFNVAEGLSLGIQEGQEDVIKSSDSLAQSVTEDNIFSDKLPKMANTNNQEQNQNQRQIRDVSFNIQGNFIDGASLTKWIREAKPILKKELDLA